MALTLKEKKLAATASYFGKRNEACGQIKELGPLRRIAALRKLKPLPRDQRECGKVWCLTCDQRLAAIYDELCAWIPNYHCLRGAERKFAVIGKYEQAIRRSRSRSRKGKPKK